MVFCGGETLTLDLQERFFSVFADTELYNMYGPTEAAIDVTYWHCERESEEDFVPLGRPLSQRAALCARCAATAGADRSGWRVVRRRALTSHAVT